MLENVFQRNLSSKYYFLVEKKYEEESHFFFMATFFACSSTLSVETAGYIVTSVNLHRNSPHHIPYPISSIITAVKS